MNLSHPPAPPLNTRHWDNWSFVHLASGVLFGWFMNPVAAFALLAFYEPVEIFLLSPYLYRRFRIVFGNEAWNNALVDLVCNTVGIFIGYKVMRALIEPPLILFS